MSLVWREQSRQCDERKPGLYRFYYQGYSAGPSRRVVGILWFRCYESLYVSWYHVEHEYHIISCTICFQNPHSLTHSLTPSRIHTKLQFLLVGIFTMPTFLPLPVHFPSSILDIYVYPILSYYIPTSLETRETRSSSPLGPNTKWQVEAFLDSKQCCGRDFRTAPRSWFIVEEREAWNGMGWEDVGNG